MSATFFRLLERSDARRSKRGSFDFKAPVEPTREASSIRNVVVKDARIQRVLELLQRNHAPQSDEVAMTLNLSPSRFRHLFREELGVSPHHYLTWIRLRRARELLGNSFLRVKEIAG